MNTRKANFRKLRLPSTEHSNGQRNRDRKATTTISHFFSTDPENVLEEDKEEMMVCSEPMPSPIEYSPQMPSPIEKLGYDPEDKPKPSTRTKLKTFLPKDKRMKPDNALSSLVRKTNDFESPAKSIKAAPKIKEKKNSKAKAKPRSKKQQTIKSAFFQNEELFSDVTAQHCLVDNVNPDEMQMALALSRSEVEILGSVEDNCTDKNEGIRDKLKKFGFQVAECEDFNYTAAYKLGKGKNKWANKFTPLTLRNSSRQLEKVNQKVQDILNIQLRSYEFTLHDEEVTRTDSVQSSNLLPFLAVNRIIQADLTGRLETVDFYVLSLFEPSRTKPGYLLKDMRRIPGRDRSPVNTKSSLKEDCIMHDSDFNLYSPVLKRVRVDESTLPIESVLCLDVDTGSKEMLEFSQQSLPSPITVPYDSKQRRRKTPTVLDFPNITSDSNGKSICSISYHKASSLNSGEEILKEFNTTPIHETNLATTSSSKESEMNSSILLRPMRASSPDIFADSDVEMETDFGSEMEKLKCTSIGDNIETYEIFSSDEVKTFSDFKGDSCDRNHNSVLAMIDLTQQGSETSSQSSTKLIPVSEPIQPYQEVNDLPSTSFGLRLNEETLTKSRSLKEAELSFEGNVLDKSTLTKRKNGFSFGSSASSDFCKSSSFNKSKDEEKSIDLTQNDDDEIDCIVLSDDEVNYSIRKADKSLHVKDEKSSSDNSFQSDSKEKQEFSFVDFVAATQSLATQSEEFELSFTENPPNNSVSSLEMDLSKRSDFGILDEQSPFKTPTKTPKKTPRKTTTNSPKSANTSKTCRRALSESFLDSPVESSAPLKRFSSSNKFKEFTKSEEESFSDLDDIDKLIYGSPTKKVYKKPTGLTQLLTGVINEKIVTPEKPNKEVPQEFEFNSRTYLVRTVDVSRRPNFATMDESALLDKLYRYGIKPLKRKQAEKILEYIYNQTHPCLVDEVDLPATAMSDSNTDLLSQDEKCTNSLDEDESEINEDPVSEVGSSKFNLKDCWGHILLSDTIPSMEIKDEQYFFQTNNSKKISTAQLPLHIAWYNLLKSNTQLHEAILYYEPIDLQEVYLFFKGIGYRYDPKEIKYFFDSRSIIFRYDVNKSESSAGSRHVRKKRQKIKK